jgi:hypothetical protein
VAIVVDPMLFSLFEIRCTTNFGELRYPLQLLAPLRQ